MTKFNVRDGTCYIDGNEVYAVLDSTPARTVWFKGNDVAGALGYVNTSSAITRYVNSRDKNNFGHLSLHDPSQEKSAHPRNVFLNESGVLSFVSAVDPSCTASCRNAIQKLKAALSEKSVCVTALKAHPLKIGHVSRNPIPLVADVRTVHLLPEENEHLTDTSFISIKKNSFIINECMIVVVLDTSNNAWFRGNDVTAAYGYTNASSCLSRYVSGNNKLQFKNISLSTCLPSVDAHPLNIFLNENGLVELVSRMNPSSAKNCITRIREYKNLLSSSHVASKPLSSSHVVSKPPNSFHMTPKSIEVVGQNGQTFLEQLKTEDCFMNIDKNNLTINSEIIAVVLDMKLSLWFRGKDVAAAFGYDNFSSISRHISSDSKAQFKAIELHGCSPLVDAHPLNIFLSESGLHSYISEMVGSSTVCQSVIKELKNIYTCHNAAPAQLKHIPLGASPSVKKIITTPTDKNQSSRMSNAQFKKWVVDGFVQVRVVQDEQDELYKVVSVDLVSAGSFSSHERIKYNRMAYGASKLAELIQHFLSHREVRKGTYSMPIGLLCKLVERIANNFEQTIHHIHNFVVELRRVPSQSRLIPSMLNEEDVKKLANSSDPSGRNEWIYIASCERYAENHHFKVGSTSRLAKRVSGYQTGRMEEDFLHYYWVKRVFDSKKIDNMILFFLDSWSQKVTRGTKICATEMYTLEYSALQGLIISIINYFENSQKYVDEVLK